MGVKFCYKAKDTEGKMVNGTVQAGSENEAIANLKERNLFIISLQKSSVSNKWDYIKNIYDAPLKSRELASFSRQFGQLIKAGVPLVESLETLSKQIEKTRLQSSLNKTVFSLKEGKNLSEAFEISKGSFPPLYIRMIGAGEKAGTLEEVIERLALYYEREMEIQEKLKGAFIYPLILIFVSVFVTYFLITHILPEFVLIFDSLEANLPFVSILVLKTGEIIKANISIILIVLLLSFLLFKFLYTKEKSQRYFDKILLYIPIVNGVIKKTNLARFSRTISILLKSGINIVESLKLGKDTVSNRVLKDIIEDSLENIEKGYSFSAPFINSKFVPPLFKKMTQVGEKAGTLDDMLEKSASIFETESKFTMDNLCSTIEPLLILVMMTIISFIVLAIVLPMLEMWQVF